MPARLMVENFYNPQHHFSRLPALRALAAGGTLAAILIGRATVPAQAANITRKSNDAVGTSSFTGSTNWSINAVPAAGNAYFSSTFTLRFSGQWVVAGGWLVGATNNALGTNSIIVDPLFPLDSSAGNSTLAGSALLEPKYDLNSSGTLTLTNGGQMAWLAPPTRTR